MHTKVYTAPPTLYRDCLKMRIMHFIKPNMQAFMYLIGLSRYTLCEYGFGKRLYLELETGTRSLVEPNNRLRHAWALHKWRLHETAYYNRRHNN